MLSWQLRPCFVEQVTVPEWWRVCWLFCTSVCNSIQGFSFQGVLKGGSGYCQGLESWGSGLSVVFVVFCTHHLGPLTYIIITTRRGNSRLSAFVFTVHITLCREACSRRLFYRVFMSREEILFSQEWVERHLVGGILVGQ